MTAPESGSTSESTCACVRREHNTREHDGAGPMLSANWKLNRMRKKTEGEGTKLQTTEPPHVRVRAPGCVKGALHGGSATRGAPGHPRMGSCVRARERASERVRVCVRVCK
jgi:hypothetical protein